MSQYEAGEANGKRLYAASGNTRAAIAGSENQRLTDGAPIASRLTTSWSIAATVRNDDQQLEPVLPRELADSAHALKVLHASLAASYLGRRPNHRQWESRIRPPDDVDAPRS